MKWLSGADPGSVEVVPQGHVMSYKKALIEEAIMTAQAMGDGGPLAEEVLGPSRSLARWLAKKSLLCNGLRREHEIQAQPARLSGRIRRGFLRPVI